MSDRRGSGRKQRRGAAAAYMYMFNLLVIDLFNSGGQIRKIIHVHTIRLID